LFVFVPLVFVWLLIVIILFFSISEIEFVDGVLFRTSAHDGQKLRCDTWASAHRHPTYGDACPVDAVPFPSADGAIQMLLSERQKKSQPAS
jgi:hypothetical protein